jgi:hypothetical protein
VSCEGEREIVNAKRHGDGQFVNLKTLGIVETLALKEVPLAFEQKV